MPTPHEPNCDEVKELILKLPRDDRAMLRPWILARLDVRGYVLEHGRPKPEAAAPEDPRS